MGKGYKSDHEFRTDLWKQVIKGLSAPYVQKAHRNLGDNYEETKNEMEYDQLLEVVKEVMNDYPEWTWTGSRWKEEEEDGDDE